MGSLPLDFTGLPVPLAEWSLSRTFLLPADVGVASVVAGVLWLFLVACVVSLVGLTAGLLVGGILLTRQVSKLHLLWLLPLVNLAGLAAVEWFWWREALAQRMVWPDGLMLAMESVCAAGSGLLAVAVLAPLQVMVRILRTRSDGPAEADAEPLRRLLERPPATTPYPSFREGFLAPWEGFLFLCYRPALWRHVIVPVLLNVVITLATLVALLAAAAGLATLVHELFPEGWGWLILEILVSLFLVLAATGMALVAWKLLEGILCGHFYGKLAWEVEHRIGLPPEELREIPFWREVADTLLDVTALVGINLGCLLLHVVPVIGSIVGIGLSLYNNCYLLGRDYFEFPLTLRGRPLSEQRIFAQRFRAHTLGLGCVCLLFNFVPVLGPVILTTAAVGAVLLYRRLTAERVAPALSRSTPP